MVDVGLRPEALLGSSSPAWVVLRVDLLREADSIEELVFPAGIYASERLAAAATDRLNDGSIGKARYFYRPTRVAVG